MDSEVIIDITRQAFLTTAILAGPVLGVALLFGTLMSLLQTVTQVQDQSISFVPKLVVVSLLLLALMPWMTDYYVEYAREAIRQIPAVVLGG